MSRVTAIACWVIAVGLAALVFVAARIHPKAVISRPAVGVLATAMVVAGGVLFLQRRPSLTTMARRVGMVFGFAALYVLLQTFEPPYLRKWVLFAVLVPFIVHFAPALARLFRRADHHQRATLGYLAVAGLVFFIPGAYFPPFFHGIPGWENEPTPQPATEIVDGVQLVDAAGRTVWFSNALTNPVNFLYRQTNAIQDPAARKDLFTYYLFLYELHFPWLKEGRLPNQRYLGPLGFPGHSPYRSFDYASFPPAEVARVELVVETYAVASRALVSRSVVAGYDAAELRANRGALRHVQD